MKEGIDVIITQPTSCDFPIFRHQIREARKIFNKVIICFSPSNHEIDITEEFKKSMEGDDITFLDPVPTPSGADWRDHAVKRSLEVSDAKKILFLEQDFIVPGGLIEFMRILHIGMPTENHVVSFTDNMIRPPKTRLHPAFIYISRELVDKTTCGFGVQDGHDHFGAFCQQLYQLNVPILLLQDVFILKWQHMTGLTHNYHLITSDMRDYMTGLTDFIAYNKRCIELIDSGTISSVPLFENLIRISAHIEK